MTTPPENAGRDQGGPPAAKAARQQRGRFGPGRSGNPAGKPPGTRNRATLAIQALLDGEAEALTRKVIELALAGDVSCLRLCLDRLCPVPREHGIALALPEITRHPSSVAAAHTAILAAVSEGTITPEQGEIAVRLIDATAAAVGAVPKPRPSPEKRARQRALEHEMTERSFGREIADQADHQARLRDEIQDLQDGE